MLESLATVAPYLVWFGSLVISGSLVWSNRHQRRMLAEHVTAFGDYTRALNEVLTEKREELRKVNANVEALTKRIDERLDLLSSAAKKHVEDDGNKLSAVDERMGQFERGLDNFQAKLNEVIERFNRSNQQVSALISRITDAENVQVEHTKTFQELREVIATQPDAEDACQQQIEALTERLDALNNEVFTLRGAQALAESELTKLVTLPASTVTRDEHASLHRYVVELAEHVNGAVAQATQRFEAVEADISQFSEGFNQHAERLNGVEHETDVTRRLVRDGHGGIGDMSSHVEDLRSKLSALRDEFDELDETVEQIDGDLATVEKTVAAQTSLLGAHDNALRLNDARVTQALNDLQAVANREPGSVNALGERIEQVAQELGHAIDQLSARMHQASAPRPNGHDVAQEPLGAQ